MVDSFAADYAAGCALSRALPRSAPPPDAVVLAGFGNYGTAAVKEVMDIPVVNCAEAAVAFALGFCHRFAVLTTSARMVPYTEDVLTLLGVTGRCSAVRSVMLPALDAADPSPASAQARVVGAVERLIEETGADLVVLGGARLSPYASCVRDRVPVPVIEPIACAVQLAEASVRLGLRQSKRAKFAPPSAPREERV